MRDSLTFCCSYDKIMIIKKWLIVSIYERRQCYEKTYIIFMIVALLVTTTVISVGYAAVSGVLMINSSVSFGGGSYDVYIQQIDPMESAGVEIKSTATEYIFLYEADGAFVELGRGSTVLLCSEATYPTTFTGVYWGLFSENGKISFTYFSVKQLDC